ncbi:cupin domain-containing protein [Puniceibacterium confluentis]|uniref:cupin domain-containing protein n=1 Tax=Puniceibacterium confluentis TaxID=1958944 RepID=UPI001645F1A0|nr:cupin domain-containing protein [Puniceibacterium confluentis]
MASIADHRTIARIAGVAFEPMTIENRVCDDAWWHNISFDEETGKGSYLMMFAAGACSNPHRHLGMEEFYVLEGELVDCDGQVYAAGDFVSLRAGSQHFSTSPGGCKLIVTHHGRTRTLTQEEWAEVEWTAET